MAKEKWCGPPPETCEVCGRPNPMPFVDGKTKDGPWAFMCVGCHELRGTGLGLGRGQKYEQQFNGTIEKVEG